MDATQDPQQKQPLAPLWVGIAIALLPPLGIYLLWRHPVLKASTGWRKVAYAWGGLWLLIQIGNASSETKKPAVNDSPVSVAKESPNTPVVEEDHNDSDYQAGYRYVQSALEAARRAPPALKRDAMRPVMELAEEAKQGSRKRPRLFYKGAAQAMDDLLQNIIDDIKR